MSRAAELPKLAMLRESFLHGKWSQDWLGDWWAKLLVNDRRTLLALAGVDDSEANAKRPWLQYLTKDRDQIVKDCKRLQRLTVAIAWA